MENTLKQLQELQLEALQNNITYQLSIGNSHMRIEMYYTNVSEEMVDNRNFSATFSNDDSLAEIKLECIKKFIDDIKK
jgi:hypothetical protein